MHHILQRLGIPPDELNAKPPGVRAFIVASMRVQLEEEERLRNRK